MTETAGGYSVFSSAWFALMFGDGGPRERLASALLRVSTREIEGLTPTQQSLLQQIGPQRIRDLESEQVLELVESLSEDRMHQLADAIAQLYLIAVRPNTL